jgi:predicted GIY-YIG superfamily endonuclease
MADFAQKNVMQNEMIVKSIGKKNKIKLTEEDKGKYKEQYEEFINEVLECHVATKKLETV